MAMLEGTHEGHGKIWKAEDAKAYMGSIRQLQEGGLVTETGMAMLHGSPPNQNWSWIIKQPLYS